MMSKRAKPRISNAVPPVVLVTGCSSGIGYAAAHGLRERGYRVFATARRLKDVEALASEGLESLQLDVNSSASIDAAMEALLSQTGGTLDALFNNAGYGQHGAVEDLSRDALREQFETNLFGVHELTCRALQVMRRQGHGRIVNNSSLLGFVALRYRGAYNASKFALEGLTDTLRLELAGTNIHVSLIEPGPIESRFRQNALEAFQRQPYDAQSPHAGAYAAATARLDKAGLATAFTLPPHAIMKPLLHALESRRPRARYRLSLPSQAFWVLRRLLPTAVLDQVLLKVSKAEAK